MERLTERDEYGNADIIALSDMMPELYAELSFSETNALTDTLNKLAAYEDAEENGTLIKLPCKVGAFVWCIDGGVLRTTRVAGFTLWGCENKIIGNFGDWDFNEIGKNVFITRVEAEKALKERESK